MTPEQIRLECLKLALGRHAVQGIEFAKANALKFESFVREAEPFKGRALTPDEARVARDLGLTGDDGGFK